MENKNMKIFGLSSNQSLTKKLCKFLNIDQSIATSSRFKDGEILVQSTETVRGQEIFIVQSTSQPVNDNLMELLISIDAFKRASAEKINVVIPYFGYARQDRKAKGRQPITAKLVANLIEKAGADRLIVFDLHSTQIMGFFDIPVDNFSTSQIIATEILNIIVSEKMSPETCTLVSPDQGGLTRVHSVAKYLQNIASGIAVIAKRRPEPNKAEVEFVLGDIKGKNCFIIDDMIDTGGTIVSAARALKDQGANEVYILACHGLFNGDAKEKMTAAINDNVIKSVIVTDTIEIPEEKKFKNLKIISVDKLLGSMIKTSINKESLTNVYNNFKTEIDKKIEEIVGKK